MEISVIRGGGGGGGQVISPEALKIVFASRRTCLLPSVASTQAASCEYPPDGATPEKAKIMRVEYRKRVINLLF